MLNLVNAKAVLMKRIIALSDGNTDVGDPGAEISRVKALVIKNSSGKVKVNIHLLSFNIRSNARFEMSSAVVFSIAIQ